MDKFIEIVAHHALHALGEHTLKPKSHPDPHRKRDWVEKTATLSLSRSVRGATPTDVIEVTSGSDYRLVAVYVLNDGSVVLEGIYCERERNRDVVRQLTRGSAGSEWKVDIPRGTNLATTWDKHERQFRVSNVVTGGGRRSELEKVVVYAVSAIARSRLLTRIRLLRDGEMRQEYWQGGETWVYAGWYGPDNAVATTDAVHVKGEGYVGPGWKTGGDGGLVFEVRMSGGKGVEKLGRRLGKYWTRDYFEKTFFE